MGDGTWVEITRAVISAAWQDFFYIEAEDRSSGIRVEKSSHGLAQGAKVNVVGTVQTNEHEERYISPVTISTIGSSVVKPLDMPNRALGGGDFGNPASGQGQIGVTGSDDGLNNIGLLVNLWGRFMKTSDTTFELDDGSGAVVKCVVPSGVMLDPGWTYAVVTGISSCERVGEEIRPVLLVRRQSDIVAY